jgi:thiol-disulfide isomerase/thioredoxin
MSKSLFNYLKGGLGFILFVVLCFVFYVVYKRYITKYSLPEYAPNKEFVAGEKGETAEMLFFYTTWCPYCKKSRPAWDTLKTEFVKYGDVKIIYREIDCDKEPGVADDYNVKGYPTIKMIYRNTTFEYDAKPDVETLKRFIRSSIKA